MKPPAPPRVDDGARFWTDPPPEPSQRCLYWVAKIQAGWRPNARVESSGYDGRAHFYGVYIWESLHVIDELLARLAGTTTGRGPHDDAQARAYRLLP